MRIALWEMIPVGASTCGQWIKCAVDISSWWTVGTVDLFDWILERPTRQGGASRESTSFLRVLHVGPGRQN